MADAIRALLRPGLALGLLMAAFPARADGDAGETVRSLVLDEDPLRDRMARSWLDRVRRDPIPHMDSLLRYVNLKAVAESPDWEASRMATNAAAVLVDACGEQGRSGVAMRLAQLWAERDRLRAQAGDSGGAGGEAPEVDRPRLRKMEYRLRHLEEALLDVFTRAKDGRLAGAVVGRLESGDLGALATYVEYLDATARGDDDVKRRLGALVVAEGTPMYQNARLKALVKAAPERKPKAR